MCISGAAGLPRVRSWCDDRGNCMNLLICDDDVTFAEKVRGAAVPFFEANNVPVRCMVCASAEEAQALPGLENCQLAFLDVDLVTASGIELGRTLKQKNPKVLLVYISAYLEFAPQGYTVSAFRYILKGDIQRMLPVCLEDVYQELFGARRVLEVEFNRETKQVPYDDIFSLESEGRRVLVFGEEPHKLLCVYYGKLSELPEDLFENGFVRIGRSAVVNMKYIQKIAGYKVRMRNGADLSVSRASYAEVRRLYLEWKGRFGDE